MKLVSLTLAGGNREEEILEAIGSVASVVDQIVLIHTGPSADEAVKRITDCYGERVVTCYYDFSDKDTAAARNFALVKAAEHQADWAIILDTDERMQWNGLDVRSFLSSAKAEVYGALSHDGVYSKVRIVRIPAASRYANAVHEGYVVEQGKDLEVLPVARFLELPKDEAHREHVRSLIIEHMSQAVTKDPGDGRAWYYLGDAYADGGSLEESDRCLEKCATTAGHPEMRAWAAFRLAARFGDQKKWQEALTWSIFGLGVCARMAELAYWAALSCLQLDRPFDAIAWARMAIALRDESAYPSRMVWRVPAVYESAPEGIIEALLPCVQESLGR